MASEGPDARIIRIAAGAVPVSAEDVAAIRDHISAADFLSRASLAEHVTKRLRQHQWRPPLAPGQYLDDLRAAVRAASRLGVYRRRGGSLAVVVAPRVDVLPESRAASESQRLIVVIYSADRGTIITGYQVADLAEVSLPEDVIWLQ